ncbi:hypothetical protein Pyn_25928 [Prunus yedoensis var. nudiflora]|uniref:Uncharacterized protein n=1 Tax=Prunus yedoensis var. nudiflora TaxID=2094558 RepID=A0A314YKI4_PRUYE|nr:hypothetical protein Pyn_25928 [Prunus yedoensis var. nudiflora]
MGNPNYHPCGFKLSIDMSWKSNQSGHTGSRTALNGNGKIMTVVATDSGGLPTFDIINYENRFGSIMGQSLMRVFGF